MPYTAKSPLHALIKSRTGITTLARIMDVSTSTIYKWIKDNHVPVRRITDFANALDLELGQVMDYAITPDETTRGRKTLEKPQDTLALLLDVQRGTLTIEEAAEALGTSAHALQIAYVQNEHRLLLMYSTLTAFSEGRVTIKEASKALGVTRTQVYYLMRNYGIPRPERETAPKSVGRYTKNKPSYEKLAVDIIAGRVNAKQASDKYGMALRTIHRYVKKLIEPRSLNEISHWPASFRMAYALEVQDEAPRHVEKWIEFIQIHGLVMVKRVKTLPPVPDWKKATRERMMVAVLHGEHTLEEVAALRGGSEIAIKNLFDGHLRRFRLRFSEVMTLPVAHQIALGDLMIMEGSHYRKETAEADGEAEKV